MKNRFHSSLVVVSLLVIFLSLAVWTKQGQGGASPAQTWEYKSWVFTIEGSRTTLYEDGRQLPGSATPVSKANELGAQGWELVSVAAVQVGSSNPTNQYVYWFKRPK